MASPDASESSPPTGWAELGRSLARRRRFFFGPPSAAAADGRPRISFKASSRASSREAPRGAASSPGLSRACVPPLASAAASVASGRSEATRGSWRASTRRRASSSARLDFRATAALAASALPLPSARSSPKSRETFPAFCCLSAHSPRFARFSPQTFQTAKLWTRRASSTESSSLARRSRKAGLLRAARQTAAQTQPPTGCGPSSARVPEKPRASFRRLFGSTAEAGESAVSRSRAVLASAAKAFKASLCCAKA
mmetsp:Transcript_6183/g.16991  ORF Transcript_6183/g.16991 Transcript_6183/m.16991 type:complete len:255 (-) Transcript_6183:158-922(-)